MCELDGQSVSRWPLFFLKEWLLSWLVSMLVRSVLHQEGVALLYQLCFGLFFSFDMVKPTLMATILSCGTGVEGRMGR